MKRKEFFGLIGSHSKEKREEHDFYATVDNEKAIKMLLSYLPDLTNILEPACGTGHLSKELIRNGYKVISSDLIDRGYGEVKDFFNIQKWEGSIVTNPPFKLAQEFIEHSLKIIPNKQYVCMFLRVLFLEGQKRYELFKKYPPKMIIIASQRIHVAKNGDVKKYPHKTLAFAWFIWQKGYKGETIIKWWKDK